MLHKNLVFFEFFFEHGKIVAPPALKIFTITIYNNINRLWAHISKRRRYQLIIIVLLLIITSISEIISIGAVVPFLGALTHPQKIFENEYSKYLSNILNI